MSDRENDLPLVARFWAEFEESPGEEKSAVLRAWCERYPDRALAFREQVLAEFQLREVKLKLVPPGPEPAVPPRLGDFRIVRKVGEGGMGAVYEAVQEPFGRQVALKTRRGAGTPQDRQRFLREGQVLSDLHQTHILPVYAAGRWDDTDYFAMQFVDGRSLREIIDLIAHLPPGVHTPSLRLVAAEKRKAVEPRPSPSAVARPLLRRHSPTYIHDVAEVVAEVADAVAHAHEKNVLHRDLKPSNVMIDTRGHVWLIDFSLAGVASSSAPDPETATSHQELTGGGNFVGTLPFAAPEQLRGESDVRTDVWGLGVILYALLTQGRPYEGNVLPGTQSQREAELQGPLEAPRARALGVPRDLEAICRKCLEKDPRQRYQTARALSQDLRRFLHGEATEARPRGSVERAWRLAKQSPAAFAVGALVLVLVLFVAGALLQAHATNRERADQFAERANQQRDLMEHAVRKIARDIEAKAARSIVALAPAGPEELAKRTNPEQLKLTDLLREKKEEFNGWYQWLDSEPLLNLFIMNREAVLLADTYEHPGSVGTTFDQRDYYTQIDRDLRQREGSSARAREYVYSSHVYLSYQDGYYKFSIITPLVSDEVVVGFLVATVPSGPRLGLLHMDNAPKGARVISQRDKSHTPRDASQWEKYRHGVVLSSRYTEMGAELHPVDDERQERTLDRFYDDRGMRDAWDVWPTQGRFAHYARVGDSHFVAVVEQSYLEAVGRLPVMRAALVGGGLLLVGLGLAAVRRTAVLRTAAKQEPEFNP